MVNIADIAGIASVLTPNPTLTSGLRVLGSGAPTSSSAFNPFSWLGANPTPDAIKAIEDYFKKDSGGESVWDFGKIIPILGGLGGGLMGLFGGDSTANQPQGYQGGIPRYTAERTPIQQTYDPNRRPGSGGRRYFSDVDFQPVEAAQGGYINYMQGGLASLRPKGMYLGGKTDGMADQVPATISNRQPARLSDGEFVIPADVVSHLGNGNSDAGAKELFSMMDRVRIDRTGNPAQGSQINPSKYLA
jgi:hypothetical protein